MKLCDLVTVAENNGREVVLNVKPFCRAQLSKLGYFTGRETSFRIIKGVKNTISVKEKNMTTLWITDGSDTSMTEKARAIRQMIKECVAYDFGIHIGNDMAKIINTSHIKNTLGFKNHCEIMIRYFEESNPYVLVYKNDEPIKSFYNLADAKKFLTDNFIVLSSRTGLTLTNGVIETYKCLGN